MSPDPSKVEFSKKSGNIVKRYRGLSRSRSEFTLRPQCCHSLSQKGFFFETPRDELYRQYHRSPCYNNPSLPESSARYFVIAANAQLRRCENRALLSAYEYQEQSTVLGEQSLTT